MRRTYLFILTIFLCVCWILAYDNDYSDYDTDLLDEIRSEKKRNFNEQKHGEVDEPFKNLLSELEDDIGELSDLNKRNNGGSSGKSPPQQKPVTTTKATQTNSTSTLKPTSQSIVTSTATAGSVTTTKAPVKANPQTVEKKPNNESRESNAKTKKPPKGNAVHNNRKKSNPQGGSKSKESKGKGSKNLRGRKKMKNRYRTDKNKMLAQASCGKAKKYPTCIQIYRKCMYEKKKQRIRCKQRKGNNSRGRLGKYSNLKGRKLFLARHGLKQNRKGKQQQSNKKNSIQDKKQWKNKGNNGKKERKSPQNNLPKNSPRKQEGVGNGNNQSRKNQKGKSSPSGNTIKPLPKDRRGKVNKDNDSINVLKEKQTLENQKKMVNGEIKGLLKYLRRVKGHLYHIDKKDGKRKDRKTKGKSNSN